jgi:hypothetical protein
MCTNYVTFEAVTGVTVKITDLWDVTLLCLVHHYQLLFYPEDGGSKFLYSVNSILDSVTSHLKRQ